MEKWKPRIPSSFWCLVYQAIFPLAGRMVLNRTNYLVGLNLLMRYKSHITKFTLLKYMIQRFHTRLYSHHHCLIQNIPKQERIAFSSSYWRALDGEDAEIYCELFPFPCALTFKHKNKKPTEVRLSKD